MKIKLGPQFPGRKSFAVTTIPGGNGSCKDLGVNADTMTKGPWDRIPATDDLLLSFMKNLK